MSVLLTVCKENPAITYWFQPQRASDAELRSLCHSEEVVEQIVAGDLNVIHLMRSSKLEKIYEQIGALNCACIKKLDMPCSTWSGLVLFTDASTGSYPHAAPQSHHAWPKFPHLRLSQTGVTNLSHVQTFELIYSIKVVSGGWCQIHWYHVHTEYRRNDQGFADNEI